jgi:molecular chaperone GrpE
MNDRTNGSPAGPRSGARGHDGHDTAEGQPSGAQQKQPSGAQQEPPSRTRAEERIAGLGAPPSLEAEVERLRSELARAEQEAADAKAGWQRSAADLQNYKRRAEQERAERMGLASDMLLLKVLALADDFDLAVEHVPAEAQGSPWVEGIVAIDRKIRALLESEGVTAMRTEGQPFDPREHQAVSHEDSADVPDGTVLRELQRGYRIRDRVLRPALVAVARNDRTDQTRSK